MAIPKVKPDVVADDEEKMGVEVEVTPEDQIIDGEPMPAEETAALDAAGIDPGALSDEEQAALGALDTPAARRVKRSTEKRNRLRLLRQVKRCSRKASYRKRTVGSTCGSSIKGAGQSRLAWKRSLFPTT